MPQLKILHIGDVYGRTGRKAVETHLPTVIKKHKPDLVCANVDNAAHGSSVTAPIIAKLRELGIDLFFGGDHILNRSDAWDLLKETPALLRPDNYPKDIPGQGQYTARLKDGRMVVCLHLSGQVYMKSCDNPFKTVEARLKTIEQSMKPAAIIVDFHAEATAEKVAMGHHLDGRVSAVIGTHTHVPTADTMILPGGTAYMTDVGMTGDYSGVIGADPVVPLERFIMGASQDRLKPGENEATFCAVLVTVDDTNKKATEIKPIRIGGFWSERAM